MRQTGFLLASWLVTLVHFKKNLLETQIGIIQTFQSISTHDLTVDGDRLGLFVGLLVGLIEGEVVGDPEGPLVGEILGD